MDRKQYMIEHRRKMEKSKKANEFAEQVINFVSGANDEDFELFCQSMERVHRTHQQRFYNLLLKWTNHISDENFRYDGRNEASVDLAKKIKKVLEETGSYLPYI